MKGTTQEVARELFDYRDGRLYWRINVAKNVKAGSEAGSKDNHKGLYKTLMYKGKATVLHRVIFLHHKGYLPEVVDHINGDTFDNRIENLRAATHTQNSRNSKCHITNKTGVKGISQRAAGLWRVCIRLGGKRKFDKSFTDFELAEFVANEARTLYHGEFANNGVKT
jgi:hypothetical protein